MSLLSIQHLFYSRGVMAGNMRKGKMMTDNQYRRYLAPKGLFFPVDPSPQAKIGGMVSVLCD